MSLPRNSTQNVITGTKFFRLASKQILGRFGGNMQNISKDMRSIYVPDGFDNRLIDKCYRYLQTKDLGIFSKEELLTIRIFDQVDQSGAEALIVAYLCRAGNFRDLFLNGVKPHVYVAMKNFIAQFKLKAPEMSDLLDRAFISKISLLKTLDGWKALDQLIKDTDNWPAQERYYFIAKMICHASNYGMKAPTFQVNVLEKSEGKIVLTRQEAETSLGNYQDYFPEIQEWHQETEEFVKKNGFVYNLFGYPITFTQEDMETTKDFKDVYAAAPQSTVGIITHVAFTNLQLFLEASFRTGTIHALPKLPETVTQCLDTVGARPRQWDLLNNCHDSYLAQCPLGDEEEMSKVMQTLMNQELTSPRGEKFNMKSEAQIGFNWGPAKKLPKDKEVSDEIINKYNLIGLR